MGWWFGLAFLLVKNFISYKKQHIFSSPQTLSLWHLIALGAAFFTLLTQLLANRLSKQVTHFAVCSAFMPESSCMYCDDMIMLHNSILRYPITLMLALGNADAEQCMYWNEC